MGNLTEMVFIAAGTRVLDCCDDYFADAVVVHPAARVGDLDFAAAVGAGGPVVLPVVGEGDYEGAVLVGWGGQSYYLFPVWGGWEREIVERKRDMRTGY